MYKQSYPSFLYYIKPEFTTSLLSLINVHGDSTSLSWYRQRGQIGYPRQSMPVSQSPQRHLGTLNPIAASSARSMLSSSGLMRSWLGCPFWGWRASSVNVPVVVWRALGVVGLRRACSVFSRGIGLLGLSLVVVFRKVRLSWACLFRHRRVRSAHDLGRLG